MLYILILLSILGFNGYGSNKLPLPSSVRHLSIVYEKVIQINNWSCGYNVLFNAANLEDRFGIYQPNSKFSNFSNICSPYVLSCGLNTYDSSSNTMLDYLSKALKLCPFNYLHLNKNNMPEYLLPHSVSYSYPSGASNKLKEKAKQDALNKIFFKKTQDLKKYLSNNINKPAFLHFACHVISDRTPHVVLLSIYKDKFGKKTIYINDNLNAPILNNSDILKYISFINKTFLIY